MKCARCGKSMDKAAAFIGSNPIGPKCLEKLGDKPLKISFNKSKHDDNETPDLFQNIENNHKT